MKKILYEVEIQFPTNSGEYSIRKIFKSEKTARSYVDRITGCYDEVSKSEPCEWDPRGPNWELIGAWEADEEYITIARIENDYRYRG